MTEMEILEGRYRRLLKFDRGLWAAYGITALVPAYFLFASSNARVFHALGVLVIVAVALSGWVVDTRLLDGRLRSETGAYAVTGAFVLSRVFIVCFGIFVVRSQLVDVFGSELPSSTFWNGLLELLVAPPVAYLLFFGVFYRFIYHVSVHFLLKIEQTNRTASGHSGRAKRERLEG